MSEKMTTSEPTTGELIREFKDAISFGMLTITIMDKVVERLESQERELSGIAGELEAMTARAESAERERDAAKAEKEQLSKENMI